MFNALPHLYNNTVSIWELKLPTAVVFNENCHSLTGLDCRQVSFLTRVFTARP